MKRRQYLAAAAGLAGPAAAGCTAFAEETVLDAPTRRRDGRSVYYLYQHEDEDVLRVSFNTQPETAAIQRLRAYIEQPGDTTLDDYRFRFKPGASGDAAADVYLRPPPLGHADAFDAYRDGDWTVVEGSYETDRRVTTKFEVLVYGGVQDAPGLPPLLVDYEVTVSEDGYLAGTVVARDRTTVSF